LICDNTGLTQPECSCSPCVQALLREYGPAEAAVREPVEPTRVTAAAAPVPVPVMAMRETVTATVRTPAPLATRHPITEPRSLSAGLSVADRLTLPAL